MIIRTVDGNILDAPEKYIAHQCNCNTIKSHGLSKSIVDHFGPWADVYRRRSRKGPNSSTKPDTPGEVIQASSPTGDKVILCLMAQWTPSKPGKYSRYYPDTYSDTSENRKRWFQMCLDYLDETISEPVAIPYGIGCGLAGGDWADYQKMLDDCKTKVILYKLINP